ncbi:MAG: dicarboxylate/amino acid:cation symporter [bacterium]|nr:dicarboxylate/amino acid:cation symporter [bacterium]
MTGATRPRSNPIFVLMIFIGMILGGVVGAVLGREIPFITLLGDLFLQGLKMLIIPLVGSSMIVAVASLGDVRKLGRMGGVTILYYLTTTIMAVIIGLVLVNLINPGNGVDAGQGIARDVAAYSFLDVIRGIVPANIFKAMADGKILPMIFFSLFFGGCLTTIGKRAQPVVTLFEGIFDVSMKMTRIIVATAPIGVFALVATRLGKAGGWEMFIVELEAIGRYALTVISGLAIHGVIVLPTILFVIGRRSPLQFIRDMIEPVFLAFSTASSSATLPVTMETISKKAGVDSRVGNFVLPLGATINMDGTALYEAVAAVFIAQAYGLDLSFPTQLVIVLTATLAAIGAAGIPQAGLVTMVMVLHTAGLPVEGVGLLLAIDWFLDRFRTAVNVWGDAVGAAVLERFVSFPDSGPARTD